jgi:hypothetical protein
MPGTAMLYTSHISTPKTKTSSSALKSLARGSRGLATFIWTVRERAKRAIKENDRNEKPIIYGLFYGNNAHRTQKSSCIIWGHYIYGLAPLRRTTEPDRIRLATIRLA